MRRIGILLITIFVQLRVVVGRSRKLIGSPTAVLCRGLEKNDMVRVWHGHGMGMAWHGKCESDTAALCKWNEKDTL